MASEKITGIVTDVVRHNDRHNVVTLFTRDRGRMAFLSPAGTGRTAAMRRAGLQLLSLVEAEVNIRGDRDLQLLGKFSSPHTWSDIYFNPVKSAIAMFMAEFINNYCRHSGPDPQAWDFIVRSIHILDRSRRGTANFHIAFLISFLQTAGIFPDLENASGRSWLDMQAGTATTLPPPHRDVVEPADMPALMLLSRMNLANYTRFRFSAGQRRRVLETLLKYYAIHFPGLTSLKSPKILAEVFE